MPIIVEGRELELPREIPEARRAFEVPGGECFGCYLGDASPDLHDIPDACEYLGGFIYTLPEEG